MADEPNELPPSRIVRWVLLGGVILFAVALYFRSGRDVPPVGASPAESAEPAAPAPATPTPTR